MDTGLDFVAGAFADGESFAGQGGFLKRSSAGDDAGIDGNRFARQNEEAVPGTHFAGRDERALADAAGTAPLGSPVGQRLEHARFAVGADLAAEGIDDEEHRGDIGKGTAGAGAQREITHAETGGDAHEKEALDAEAALLEIRPEGDEEFVGEQDKHGAGDAEDREFEGPAFLRSIVRTIHGQAQHHGVHGQESPGPDAPPDAGGRIVCAVAERRGRRRVCEGGWDDGLGRNGFGRVHGFPANACKLASVQGPCAETCLRTASTMALSTGAALLPKELRT